MLKTLFKHEMRATAKTFMWLYIAFVVIAVVNVLVSPLSPFNAGAEGAVYSHGPESVMAPQTVAISAPSILQTLLMILYFLAIAAIAVATLVIVILRFYRNLLGDEGYLMMTLPVSRENNILSKLLVAAIWNICTGVLIFLSLMLLFSRNLGDISNSITQAINMGAPVDRWITLGVVALVVTCFSSVLMLYAAMAIGPNLLKNRVGGSILAFIIIYIASQFIMLGVLIGVANSYGGLNLWTASGPADMGRNAEFAFTQTDNIITAISIGCIIASAAIGVCCWFLTRYMLKRKLNLA